MRKFLHFAVIAGCGWLLDLGLLLTLVQVAHVPPAAANTGSSLIAASAVFLVSRVLVFERASGGLHARYGLFVTYTLGVILLASLAVGALVAHVRDFATMLGVRPLTTTQAVGIAKVLVTPPQLLLNFAVSRLLSEHAGLRASRAS